MSGEKRNGGTGREHEHEHEHWNPEDLLELALEESAANPARAAERAEIRACPQCARALEQQGADARAVRAAVLELSAADEARASELAQTVLERTTREDLSWRGDWRLVGRYLHRRWQASGAVRLLAASLLLHFLALPVLAYVLIRQASEAPRVVLSIEPPAVDLPLTRVPVEPRRDLVREPEPEPPAPWPSAPEAQGSGDRLVHARRALLDSGAPLVPSELRRARAEEEAALAVAHLLAARSRRLSLGSFDDTVSEPAPSAPVVARALWAELLLDDWALSGRRDARLALALARLRPEAESSDSVGASGRVLARHALRRASSYGLDVGGASAAGDPGAPFDRAWFTALEQAALEAGAPVAGAELRAWLEWGRKHAR